MPKEKFQAIVALTASAAIWGGSIPIIKYTLQFVPPFTFLFLRLSMAGLIVLPFFVREISKRKYKIADLRPLIMASLFGQTIHLSFGFVGISKTTAFEAIIISALFPVLTVFGGVIFLKEKLTLKEMIGFLTILLGVSITMIPSIVGLAHGESLHFVGNILLVLSGISWTCFVLTSKDLLKKYSPRDLTFIGFYIGIISLVPFVFWEQRIDAFRFVNFYSALPGIIYVAIASSIMAYSLYEFGLKRLEASETDLFEYLIPIFSFIPAFLIFKEPFTNTFITGAAILVVGVMISTLSGTRRRLKHHRTGVVR